MTVSTWVYLRHADSHFSPAHQAGGTVGGGDGDGVHGPLTVHTMMWLTHAQSPMAQQARGEAGAGWGRGDSSKIKMSPWLCNMCRSCPSNAKEGCLLCQNSGAQYIVRTTDYIVTHRLQGICSTGYNSQLLPVPTGFSGRIGCGKAVPV